MSPAQTHTTLPIHTEATRLPPILGPITEASEEATTLPSRQGLGTVSG